jgi:hypothetical protein
MHRTICCTMVMALSSVAGADVLVSQPSDRPSEPSFFSDAVPGQFFGQRMADNFTLSELSNIDAVRFWGGSQNFAFADLTNMISWTVTIFRADDTGGVDTAAEVFTATYASASDRPGDDTSDDMSGDAFAMTVTATGDTNFTGGEVFDHVASTGDLQLEAGDYWVSVGATLENGFGDAWVWAGSTQGDLVNATDFFDGNGFIAFDPTFNDLAFEIQGSRVPSPAGVSTVGVGVLFSCRRRRA